MWLAKTAPSERLLSVTIPYFLSHRRNWFAPAIS
jgi:hypothetical protein